MMAWLRLKSYLTYCAIIIYSQGVCSLQDWLNSDFSTPTQLIKTNRGTIQLTNGLLYREFILNPDFATIDYFSIEKQSSLLRAMNPEAVISLDGQRYSIGGVLTNIPRAYLNRSALAEDMKADPHAFHYVSHTTAQPEAPFKYTPKRGAPSDIVWPPKGLRLDVTFRAPYFALQGHQTVKVIVHYEMYDGIPLLVKWLSVSGLADVMLTVDAVEILSVNWPWSEQGYQWIFVETDQAHGTLTNWYIDPKQASMPGSFEPTVNCTYEIPPTLAIRDFSQSFRVHELVHASSDPERVGLAKRRKLRLLAPQTQENPIFFHMTNSSSEAFRSTIDQMAEVGFEMLIYSFGSSFNIESTNDTYIERIARDIAYAKSRGIEVGGYDLIALTRQVSPQWMAIQLQTSPSACFASGWYDHLLDRVLSFMHKTGLSMVETDGPYGGYPCSSSNHSHHHGYQDSVYQQNHLQADFFRTLQERGVYINQPDNYFYQGGSKTGMGYNENQYSLPRWQDLSVSRQCMYDDTYHYTPTIGWMHVPLVVYHGGGDAAKFEPLSQHLHEYEWALAQYLGAGVAACYRGYRLYDNNNTKAVVSKWVSFYKEYRDILTSDIIHVRRADMQSVDCYMHVNHRLGNKALAMVFNPTQTDTKMTLTLPLYYTGLTTTAHVAEQGTKWTVYQLDRAYNIDIHVSLPPLGITWFLIQ